MPAFPIRTPWDHSSVDSSPRPIAASHVLHRLLVPRHPPFALDNLTTKMLASTVQFSTNDQPTTRSAPHQPDNPPAVCKARPCLADSQDLIGLGPVSERQPTGCSFRTQQGAVRSFSAAPEANRSHHRSGCTRRP